jgi:hypothetical protein
MAAMVELGDEPARCVAATLALLPLLRRGDHPRIVDVSSEGGPISEMTGGTPAYSVSKGALNALTRLLAGELGSFRVNVVCPGWVATDMGGPGGEPVAIGARRVTWGVDVADDGPTGGFWRDGRAALVSLVRQAWGERPPTTGPPAGSGATGEPPLVSLVRQAWGERPPTRTRRGADDPAVEDAVAGDYRTRLPDARPCDVGCARAGDSCTRGGPLRSTI